jgi:hypothetical protein
MNVFNSSLDQDASSQTKKPVIMIIYIELSH